MLSILLVGAQFLWLLLLAYSGIFISFDSVVPLIGQAIAVALGLWAIVAVGLHQLRIRPEVHPDARLIMNGPYRFIRHPMYTSVLLFAVCAVAADFSWLRLGVITALAATMVLKLLYEERLLDEHFAGYADYRNRSWRIIPWIF